MYWGDEKLREWAKAGGIKPYNPDRINPASIDLTLSETFRIPQPGYGWSENRSMPSDGYYLKQNGFVLCCSNEWIEIPDNALGFLYLKSSTGRKGFEHLHAGYFDPGFKGQATLEITCHWPFGRTLMPDTPFCQICLADVSTVNKSYDKTGHYQNQVGPTPAWR